MNQKYIFVNELPHDKENVTKNGTETKKTCNQPKNEIYAKKKTLKNAITAKTELLL